MTDNTQADSGQQARSKHDDARREPMTPELRQHNAEVRATQWEMLTALPQQIKSLNDKVTAGIL